MCEFSCFTHTYRALKTAKHSRCTEFNGNLAICKRFSAFALIDSCHSTRIYVLALIVVTLPTLNVVKILMG